MTFLLKTQNLMFSSTDPTLLTLFRSFFTQILLKQLILGGEFDVTLFLKYQLCAQSKADYRSGVEWLS